MTLDLISLLTIPSKGLVGLKFNVDAKDGEMSFNSSGVDLPIKASDLNISLAGVSSELEHLDINFTAEILNQFDVKGSANFGKQVSFDNELIVNLSVLLRIPAAGTTLSGEPVQGRAIQCAIPSIRNTSMPAGTVSSAVCRTGARIWKSGTLPATLISS